MLHTDSMLLTVSQWMESSYPTLESLGPLNRAGQVMGYYFIEMKFEALEIVMFPLGNV